MIGELRLEEIETLLREQTIGRIGCHARGHTHVFPVTYVYDGRAIYGHTGDGLKVRMMRENPSVCFDVEQLSDLPSWRSVIVVGRFEELHGDEADAAIQRLVARLDGAPHSETALPAHGAGRVVPGVEMTSPRQSVVYAIRVEEKTGRFELAR
ncbi:MAG TPA: pyridoxamine 5'-phosphate oxidase family protein [Kofleriaceae bacterium]|nr:pyridoxamine 5'-phosphate oxidase family protein [Kofleriaceae bacterium]